MSTQAAPTGVLVPGELYTLKAFRDRLGLSDSGVRAMRRRGMRVYREGRRSFIYADDAIEHIRTASKDVP